MDDRVIGPVLVGVSSASMMSGALLQVFDDVGLMLAIMGGLGGLVTALFNKVPWKGGLRSMALGALIGFGGGLAGPVLLKHAVGIDLIVDTSTYRGLGVSAFFMGWGQERIGDLIYAWKRKEKADA